MKAKSFWMGIVALVCMMVFTSCDKTVLGPEHYAVEIDDAFRIQIASGVIFMVYDDEVTDGFGSRVDKMADKVEGESLEEDLAKYKIALERLAEDDQLAENCLTLYNLMEPVFTEWKQQEDKDGYCIWTATEQKSGIEVTFLNNKDLDWDVDLEEEGFGAYITRIADTIMEED